jgi:hypothetical protein
MARFCVDCLFTWEDVDRVYAYTQNGDPLRAAILPPGIRSKDLIDRLKGPAGFIVDIGTHLDELKLSMSAM